MNYGRQLRGEVPNGDYVNKAGPDRTKFQELSELMEVLDTKNGKKARALAEQHVRNAARAALAVLRSQQLLESIGDR